MSGPPVPQRIVVVGNTACGKSTLATRLATRYDLVHLELDAFAHGPDWQLTSPQRFRHSLEERMNGQGWVCDGNYLSRTTGWLWPRADTIIWLDLPLWRVIPRLVARSLRRILTRQQLWNGNVEGWSALIGPRSLPPFVVASHRRKADQLPALLAGAASTGATTVRLTSPRQVYRWWQRLPSATRW